MEEENMEGFTFVEGGNQMATIRTRFPKKGKYVLTIYNKQKVDICIFIFIIIVKRPMKHCSRFPKTCNAWTNGYELLKPDAGTILTSGKKLPFSVRILNAFGVALVSPTNDWKYLSKNDDDNWTGEVDNVEPGELKLSACLTTDSSSYEDLLIFQVEDMNQSEILSAQTDEQSREAEHRKTREEDLERERLSSGQFETQDMPAADSSEGNAAAGYKDETQANLRSDDDEDVDGENSSREHEGLKSLVNKRKTRRAKKRDNVKPHPNEFIEESEQVGRKAEKRRLKHKEEKMQERKRKERAEMGRRIREEDRQKIRMWDEQFEVDKLREQMGEKEYRRQFYMERRTIVFAFMQTVRTKKVQKNATKTA
jgi:hypothetical protein